MRVAAQCPSYECMTPHIYGKNPEVGTTAVALDDKFNLPFLRLQLTTQNEQRESYELRVCPESATLQNSHSEVKPGQTEVQGCQQHP